MLREVRDSQLEDEQRGGDREHAIAENLHAKRVWTAAGADAAGRLLRLSGGIHVSSVLRHGSAHCPRPSSRAGILRSLFGVLEVRRFDAMGWELMLRRIRTARLGSRVRRRA